MAWVSAASQRPGKEEFEVVVCPAVNSWECPQVDYLVLITASGEEGGEAVAGGMAAARLTSDQLEEVPLPDLCFVGCHGFTRSPRVREISAGTQLTLLATAAEPWFGFGGRQWSLLLQGWPFPGLSWQRLWWRQESWGFPWARTPPRLSCQSGQFTAHAGLPQPPSLDPSPQHYQFSLSSLSVWHVFIS